MITEKEICSLCSIPSNHDELFVRCTNCLCLFHNECSTQGFRVKNDRRYKVHLCYYCYEFFRAQKTELESLSLHSSNQSYDYEQEKQEAVHFWMRSWPSMYSLGYRIRIGYIFILYFSFIIEKDNTREFLCRSCFC